MEDTAVAGFEFWSTKNKSTVMMKMKYKQFPVQHIASLQYLTWLGVPAPKPELLPPSSALKTKLLDRPSSEFLEQ